MTEINAGRRPPVPGYRKRKKGGGWGPKNFRSIFADMIRDHNKQGLTRDAVFRNRSVRISGYVDPQIRSAVAGWLVNHAKPLRTPPSLLETLKQLLAEPRSRCPVLLQPAEKKWTTNAVRRACSHEIMAEGRRPPHGRLHIVATGISRNRRQDAPCSGAPRLVTHRIIPPFTGEKRQPRVHQVRGAQHEPRGGLKGLSMELGRQRSSSLHLLRRRTRRNSDRVPHPNSALFGVGSQKLKQANRFHRRCRGFLAERSIIRCANLVRALAAAGPERIRFGTPVPKPGRAPPRVCRPLR